MWKVNIIVRRRCIDKILLPVLSWERRFFLSDNIGRAGVDDSGEICAETNATATQM